jgi:putative oxidoreductase
MSWFSRFLFPSQPTDPWASWLLLALRLLFGVLLLTHGLDKWIHFETLEANFPNPLHIGSRLSLLLCLFAEVVCSCFVILGLFTRLMLIPIVINMAIALLVIHQGQPFASRELAFLYLIVFLLLMLFGPGRLSFDGWIAHRLAPEPIS